MRHQLLDVLVCPDDRTRLRLEHSGSVDAAGVVDGSLRCEQGHEWQVRAAVPRMVPATAGQAETSASFSAKWSRIAPDEVEQRYRQQHSWYVQRYGFGDENGLREFLADKHLILEAGTGTGGDAARFARLAPHAQVLALDLSGAIDVAQEQFGGGSNLHYIQADLMRPPVEEMQFDFISSDQVIHHTPDAAAAFSTLAACLRPGGYLAVYVYKRKAPLRELADDWIRERSTRMSVEECMSLSQDITELGRELTRVGGTVNLPRGVPLLGIEPGEHDVQRLIYWTFLKCFWNDDFSQNLNVLVNFDWYHPPFASRHTEDEVRRWCAQAGLTVDRLDLSESGISVLARQPD